MGVLKDQHSRRGKEKRKKKSKNSGLGNGLYSASEKDPGVGMTDCFHQGKKERKEAGLLKFAGPVPLPEESLKT